MCVSTTRSTIKAAGAALVLLAALTGAPAVAQEYPSQIVRFIVPYPPGGGVDTLARPIVERLSQVWGKPVVIENKAGASTILGSQYVAAAAPDGHTVLFTSDSSITSNPHLFKTLPYDPIMDFAPVTQLVDLHQMVLLHPSVPANSLAELVALAKAKPKELNYGSYGIGSQPHLLFGMLRHETGAQIEQVPFRGLAPALAAVLAGEVQMSLGGATVRGHIDAGRMKPIATSRPTRFPAWPSVATLKEQGFPGIDPRSWFGMLAPARTPPAIVEKMQKAVAAILNEPDFKARWIEAPGHTGVGSTPADFARFIAEDLAYKGKLIKAVGITAE